MKLSSVLELIGWGIILVIVVVTMPLWGPLTLIYERYFENRD